MEFYIKVVLMLVALYNVTMTMYYRFSGNQNEAIYNLTWAAVLIAMTILIDKS